MIVSESTFQHLQLTTPFSQNAKHVLHRWPIPTDRECHITEVSLQRPDKPPKQLEFPTSPKINKTATASPSSSHPPHILAPPRTSTPLFPTTPLLPRPHRFTQDIISKPHALLQTRHHRPQTKIISLNSTTQQHAMTTIVAETIRRPELRVSMSSVANPRTLSRRVMLMSMPDRPGVVRLFNMVIFESASPPIPKVKVRSRAEQSRAEGINTSLPKGDKSGRRRGLRRRDAATRDPSPRIHCARPPGVKFQWCDLIGV